MAEEEKIPSLNRVLAEINKKAGEKVISRLSDIQAVQLKRIPCGIPALDEAIGGGFPLGRIVELFGLQSSGKSLIAQKVMAEAQKRGREVVYVDCESSFDPNFAQLLGVDTSKMVLLQSSGGEQIFDILSKLLKTRPGVVVVDSVAAMVIESEMENEVSKAEMGGKARLMNKGVRILNALNQDTILLFINQLRQQITSYGHAPKVTTGGMALQFASSVQIEVKRDNELLYEGSKKSGEVIGQIVQFNIKKNKTFIPFKTGSFKFFYDGAIE